jgi:hypothetical protein
MLKARNGNGNIIQAFPLTGNTEKITAGYTNDQAGKYELIHALQDSEVSLEFNNANTLILTITAGADFALDDVKTLTLNTGEALIV